MESLFDRLERKKQQILAAAPGIALGMATDGLALVRRRIERDGVEGASYSKALIPTFLFKKQALNAGGRDYIKRNPLGNWAGLRNAEGLQTGHVDLAHSNRMWNSLTATPAGVSGAVATAKVVSADREGADKVKYNRARYGDFLQPTPAETQLIGQGGQRAIQRILQAP